MSKYSLNETTIFDGVTGAVNTPVPLDLRLEDIQNPCTIGAEGLAGAEAVYIWFSLDGGVTFQPYNTGGSQLSLTIDDNIRACYSGTFLGFTKTASASPVTVVANVRERGI